MGQPRPLFRFYFWSFQTNITKFLQQIYVKKCPSSKRCWDSNPQPSERESLPLTNCLPLHILVDCAVLLVVYDIVNVKSLVVRIMTHVE